MNPVSIRYINLLGAHPFVHRHVFFLTDGNQIDQIVHQEDVQHGLHFKQGPDILWQPLEPHIANESVILRDPRVAVRCARGSDHCL